MIDIQKQIDTIKEKLAIIKELVPEKKEWYANGEKWTEKEIVDFEKRYNVSLPEGYKQFLLQIGDGGAGFDHHDDCSCGNIYSLREMIKEDEIKNINKVFPSQKFPLETFDKYKFWRDETDYKEWEEGEKEAENTKKFEETFGVPRDIDVRKHGCMCIGTSTDHAEYFLIITGEEKGNIWHDGTVYDGAFFSVQKSFLELSIELFDKLIKELNR